MIAYMNRWVLLAALAVGQACPLAAHAQSLDRMPESVPYALADALMPYAKRDYAPCAWRCSLPWRNRETPSHS